MGQWALGCVVKTLFSSNRQESLILFGTWTYYDELKRKQRQEVVIWSAKPICLNPPPYITVFQPDEGRLVRSPLAISPLMKLEKRNKNQRVARLEIYNMTHSICT